LEERLAVSHHEEEAARLRGFIVAEDREWAVVAGIRQGASITLVAMQLRIEVNLHRVVSRFPERVRLEERAELVNDFTAAMNAIIAAMDVEEVIRGHD
jgi:hypothetical protein